jgi:hypothetical protein
MWKIPLLAVLQYLDSDCNDFDLYDLAKVLEALALISTSEILADALEQAAKDYRSGSYSYTALQELMEKIVSYD